jgi:peptidyl-dipeptidase A
MIRTGISMLALASLLAAAPLGARDRDGQTPAPTASEAKAFVADAEAKLAAQGVIAARAEWVYDTYITQDTEAMTAREAATLTKLQVDLALGAAKYANVAGLDYDTNRKLGMLRSAITLPAPTTRGGWRSN